MRAGWLKTEDRLMAYPWSSFGLYLAAPQHQPEWLRVDRLLGEHGIQQDTPLGRQEFEMRMEARRAEESDEEALAPFRRGWCLGSEGFKARMLDRMEGKLGEHHAGALRMESAEAKAEQIVRRELAKLGWDSEQLNYQRKNDPRKLAIAARLHRETTLPLKAIAARVGSVSSKSANATLHQWMA